MAPLWGADEHSLRSGGLRYAPTTGYYLTAFQAEDVLATFSHTLGSDRVRVGKKKPSITPSAIVLLAQW